MGNIETKKEEEKMTKKLKKLKRKLRKAGRIAKKISKGAAELEKRLPSGAEIVGFDRKRFADMPTVADTLGLEHLTRAHLKKEKKRD